MHFCVVCNAVDTYIILYKPLCYHFDLQIILPTLKESFIRNDLNLFQTIVFTARMITHKDTQTDTHMQTQLNPGIVALQYKERRLEFMS